MADTESYPIITNLSTPTWEMPEEEDSGLGLSLLDDQSPYYTTQISHTDNYQSVDIDNGKGSETGASTLPVTELTPAEGHQFVTTLSFGNELMIANQCSGDDDISEKENRPPINNNINNTTVSCSSSNGGQDLEPLVGACGGYILKDKQFEVGEDGLNSYTNSPAPDADAFGTNSPAPDADDYDLDIPLPIINPSLTITTVHLVRSQGTSSSGQLGLSPGEDQAQEIQSANLQCTEGQEQHTSGWQNRSGIRVVYKPRGLDPVGNMVQQEVLKRTHCDREQDRNQLMNEAFTALGNAVRVKSRYPTGYASTRRPARLTILQAAINYIRYLEVLLDIYDSGNSDS